MEMMSFYYWVPFRFNSSIEVRDLLLLDIQPQHGMQCSSSSRRRFKGTARGSWNDGHARNNSTGCFNGFKRMNEWMDGKCVPNPMTLWIILVVVIEVFRGTLWCLCLIRFFDSYSSSLPFNSIQSGNRLSSLDFDLCARR